MRAPVVPGTRAAVEQGTRAPVVADTRVTVEKDMRVTAGMTATGMPAAGTPTVVGKPTAAGKPTVVGKPGPGTRGTGMTAVGNIRWPAPGSIRWTATVRKAVRMVVRPAAATLAVRSRPRFATVGFVGACILRNRFYCTCRRPVSTVLKTR